MEREDDDLAAVIALVRFLRAEPLTDRLASVEDKLVGCSGAAGTEAAADRGLTGEMLAATLAVRSQVGRLSDVIHACAITLALPHILEPGEQITVTFGDTTVTFDVDDDETGEDAPAKEENAKASEGSGRSRCADQTTGLYEGATFQDESPTSSGP